MLISFLVFINYSSLFIHFVISFSLGFLILLFSYFFTPQNKYGEKLSSYECGFDPFGDSRNTFNIHFYLVGIIFIIFDLEVMYLFPWSLSLSYIGWEGFFSMFIFLFILTIGFVYEWFKGALDWS